MLHVLSRDNKLWQWQVTYCLSKTLFTHSRAYPLKAGGGVCMSCSQWDVLRQPSFADCWLNVLLPSDNNVTSYFYTLYVFCHRIHSVQNVLHDICLCQAVD